MSKDNWRESTKNSVTSSELNKHADFHKKSEDLFPLLIPSFISKNIDFNNPSDPILKQVIPHKNELNQHKNYRNDPVGDMNATVAKGVIHKYHGRVLLIASGSCAINCRYCFRRNFNYIENHASGQNWKSAIDYIQSNTDIHEVILSGGDPLMLSTKALNKLTLQLTQINHIKTLRFHTRIPIVAPNRITDNFIKWLESLKFKKVMVLHCNHPKELNKKLRTVLKKISNTNTLLLNQSVLLKNINDNAQTLSQLSHRLFEFGVLPYYLNQLDKANGTHHFRISNKIAKSIHKELLQLLPGYLVPKLVEEISGKLNKSPMI